MIDTLIVHVHGNDTVIVIPTLIVIRSVDGRSRNLDHPAYANHDQGTGAVPVRGHDQDIVPVHVHDDDQGIDHVPVRAHGHGLAV